MVRHRRTPRAHRHSLGLLLVALVLGCARAPEETGREPRRTVQAAPGEVVAPDLRTAIRVDAETRLAVLSEMRTMLQAVQGIVGGVASGDTAAIRVAAATAGVAAASEASPAVQAQLGAEFVRLGMRTHLSFDSLAADAARARGRDAILRRLATVMGNCVGCHVTWRLTVEQ